MLFIINNNIVNNYYDNINDSNVIRMAVWYE